MNCNQAKPLIDERVEAERTSGDRPESNPDPRFKKLNAHLIACANCAAEYNALLQTSKLAHTVAGDTPTNLEIESMWTAIASAAALPAGSSVPVDDTTPTWWKSHQGWLLRFITASTAAAAVLLFAASIGQNALGPRNNDGINLVGGTQLAAADSVSPPVAREGNLTEPYDFKNLTRDAANSSYGYQVPFGPGDTGAGDGTERAQVAAAGRIDESGTNGRSELLLGMPLIYGAVDTGDGADLIAGARFVGGPYGKAEGLPGARFYGFDPGASVGSVDSGLLKLRTDDFRSETDRESYAVRYTTDARGVLDRAAAIEGEAYAASSMDASESTDLLAVNSAGRSHSEDYSLIASDDEESGGSYVGAYEWGGKSGVGQPRFLDQQSVSPTEPGSPLLATNDTESKLTVPRAYWMLPRSGDVSVDQFAVPNKDNSDADGPLASEEFERDESYNFIENESRGRDRFYLWPFDDARDGDYKDDSSIASDDDGGNQEEAPSYGGGRKFVAMLADSPKQYPQPESDALTDVEESKIPWWETLRYPSDSPARASGRRARRGAKRDESYHVVASENAPLTPDGVSGRTVNPPQFPEIAPRAVVDASPVEAQDAFPEVQPQVQPDQQLTTQSEPDESKPASAQQPQTKEQPARQQPAPPQGQRRTRAPASRPKIIKTGELSVEVASYEAAVDRVLEIVRTADAFLADGSTAEQAGGALVGVMVIRVVPEQFEALFSLLKKHIGRVESENVKAADVTAEFVDLQARISGLEMTEIRLQQLIKDKSFLDDVQSLLEVEREVTRVRVQIEQMQGQLRVMADRIGMSTIRITIREPARTVPSASMSVEVPVLEIAAQTLGESLRSIDGRLVSAKTAKRNDGTLKGDYQLEVSLAKFGEMLAAIESLGGRVAQREVKDRQFGDADAPWAAEVKCRIGLLMFERSRQLPSGEISVEIDDLDAAIRALNPVLGKANATVVSNDTTQRSDGSSQAELELRIPAGAYADFVDELAPLGRTTKKNISGEAGSIVGGAAEVLCNMTLTLSEPILQVPSGRILIEVVAFPDARKRLSAIVAGKGVQVLASDSEQRSDGTWVGGFRLGIKAGEMEQIVSQLEALGRVESRQIRGIGLGDLARVDPKAIGLVTLTLAEKAAIRPPVNQAGGAIRTQLRGALAGLYKSLGYILYGLIVLAPWIVIALAVGLLTARAWRRRKLKTESVT